MTRFFAVLASLLMAPALLSAQLFIPEAFDVLSVNGVEHSRFTLAKEKNITLKNGRNIVELQYRELFDNELNDAHDKVQSQPYALIIEASHSTVLRLKSPALSSRRSAEVYAKQPHFIVVDDQGAPIDIHVIAAKELTYGTVKPAVKENVSSALNQTTRPTQASDGKTPRMPFEHPVESSNVPEPDTLTLLHYWWSKASTEERNAFLKAIQEQK